MCVCDCELFRFVCLFESTSNVETTSLFADLQKSARNNHVNISANITDGKHSVKLLFHRFQNRVANGGGRFAMHFVIIKLETKLLCRCDTGRTKEGFPLGGSLKLATTTGLMHINTENTTHMKSF